jgi:hypothetical protein
MSETQSSFEDQYHAEIYEIQFVGHVHDRWAECFEGLTVTHQDDGTTVLCGPLPDQIALHSILRRIQDMNLKLISVNHLKSTGFVK